MFGLMRSHGAARESWRLHYCGTCKTIGREYGQRSRLLLNHDAVFLAELLTSLSGEKPESWGGAYTPFKCTTLPKTGEMPAILRYASATTILLTEYKLDDHRTDSGHRRWDWARRLFSSRFRKARQELRAFGFPVAECDRALGQQQAVEARGAMWNEAAEPTAEATSLVFRHGARVAGLLDREENLAQIGHLFGRLIYLIDAWEDFEKDRRSGAFNPLLLHGLTREWAAAQIRRESGDLVDALPTEFGVRLQSSVDRRLGIQFKIIQSCQQHRPGARMRRLGWIAGLGLACLIPAEAAMLQSSNHFIGIALVFLLILIIVASSRRRGGGGGCCDCCNCCGDCTCCCEGCAIAECCDCCSGCG